MDASSWDQRYRESELVWSVEPNQFVVAETVELPPGRALDLACGEGRNSIWLANRGWQVTGVDFSEVAVTKAATLAEHRLEPTAELDWIRADATAYTPEASFDLVLLAYLQLPRVPRRAALGRAAAALAPGGHLVVVAHDRSNRDEGFGGPQDPAVLYTAEDVVADVAGARDWSVLRAERVPRRVVVEEVERTAWDALVHLVAPR